MSLDFKLKRTLRGLDYPQARVESRVARAARARRRSASCCASRRRGGRLRGRDRGLGIEPRRPTSWAGRLEFYTRFYLQDDILAKVDRATMMVGLEVRAPFLDNEVVDLARRLPASPQVPRRQGQAHPARGDAGARAATACSTAPRRASAMPLTRWLKDWAMPQPSPALAFDAAALERHVGAHREGRRDERLFLWCWLVLQHHLHTAATIH